MERISMKKLGFIGKLAASLLASVMVFSSVLATNSQATVEASAAQSDFEIMTEGMLFNFQGYKILPGKYKIDDYAMIQIYYKGYPVTNYSFNTHSKNLKITKTVATAKKAGKYKVTLTAKYKTKSGRTETATRNLKVHVTNPTYKKTEATCYIGGKFLPESLLKGLVDGSLKCSIVDGKDFVSLKKKSGSYEVIGKAEGTAKLKVTDYYGKNAKTITLNVKPNHCTGIKSEYSKDALDIYSSEPEYLDECIEIKKADEDTPLADPVTATSSNPEIVKVEKKGDSYKLVSVAEGDATITVTCGDHTAKILVHSIMDDDEDDDE